MFNESSLYEVEILLLVRFRSFIWQSLVAGWVLLNLCLFYSIWQLSLGHTADIIKVQENIDSCCVFQDQDNFMSTSFLYTEHYVFCYISNALGLIYSPVNAFRSGLAAHALEQ